MRCGVFGAVRWRPAGRVGRARGATGRNRARRGAVDPASGLHARAKCAGPGDAREPAPRFRGGRPWPARPDRDRWERYQPVSRCRPKACPRESGGNRAVQRTHPFGAPGAHLTRRERHHHRERQAHARAHPGQAPQEVRLELEAAVQTGVDPFQGRAPTVAALPCGAPVRPESNPPERHVALFPRARASAMHPTLLGVHDAVRPLGVRRTGDGPCGVMAGHRLFFLPRLARLDEGAQLPPLRLQRPAVQPAVGAEVPASMATSANRSSAAAPATNDARRARSNDCSATRRISTTTARRSGKTRNPPSIPAASGGIAKPMRDGPGTGLGSIRRIWTFSTKWDFSSNRTVGECRLGRPSFCSETIRLSGNCCLVRSSIASVLPPLAPRRIPAPGGWIDRFWTKI